MNIILTFFKVFHLWIREQAGRMSKMSELLEREPDL